MLCEFGELLLSVGGDRDVITSHCFSKPNKICYLNMGILRHRQALCSNSIKGRLSTNWNFVMNSTINQYLGSFQCKVKDQFVLLSGSSNVQQNILIEQANQKFCF